MTYGDADSMQKGLCSSAANSGSNKGAWLDVSNTIDPNGAAAFWDCVKALRGGLDIQARVNEDETMAAIRSRIWRHTGGAGDLKQSVIPGLELPSASSRQRYADNC